ncbi:MAG: lamin tail domain-containing protein [bacterium]
MRGIGWSVGLLCLVWGTLIGCGTDDPVSNTNNTNGMCADECGLGDRTCLDEGRVEQCRRGTDGCFRTITVQCLETEICSDGDCIDRPKTCEDTCTPPASRCNVQGQAETCADHNNDGCYEFGGGQACSNDQFCDQADGLCKTVSCEAPCALDATQCTEGLISTCAENIQGCLTFGPGQECGADQVCEVDACVAATTCEDECEVDQALCAPDGGLRTCGNFDADTCLELSDAVACPASQVCREGACVPMSTCQDTCLANEAVCIQNDIARCTTQADGCLAFDAPAACPGTDLCASQNGTAQCAPAPVTGAVVINEVFYDALGSDDYRNGAAPTFVELFGPPGLSIDGYVVEFVNGTGGAIYSTATLPAGARLDGNGFAVLAIADSDNFLKFAAPGNKYFIMTNAPNNDGIQNGPDNVRLRNGSGAEIDAVGYGSFGQSHIFEGEGTPVPASGSGRSIGRIQGKDTDNNAADFVSFYPTPGMPNADLIINEIYFDQPGSDTGTETFVEIIAPILGWEDIPLDGYILRAVNGLNGMDYIYTYDEMMNPTINGIDFTGYGLNDLNDGLVVVCNIDTASAALLQVCTVPFEGTDFQNGPDNFVLEFNGRVIDAVGYGSFGATAVFKGEGNPKSFSSSSAGKSLGRWPISDPSVQNDTNDNATDFRLNTPSPALDNPIPN